MTSFSKRVLIFTTAYKPLIGGSEIAIENIIRCLPGIFFDIVTVHLDNSPRKETGSNYTIHRLGFGGGFGKTIFPILGFLKGLVLTNKETYQAIHAYQASQGAGAAWLLKIFKPKLSFILTLQEGKELAKQGIFIRFFRGLIIKKADRITAISNYLGDFARDINPKTNIDIVPNGVDIESFKNTHSDENIYNKLNIKKEDRVIISVSRLVKKNGLLDLIEAIPQIKERFPHLKLILIGDGPMKAVLEKKASEDRVFDSILFLGAVDYCELPAYLKIADVFVRPSLSEGLGSAFLEAMAAGTPVVATPVGGIPDFLTDEETGIFCRPHDPQSIAESVLKILSKQDLKEKLRTNAQKMVEEKYDWKIIANRFEKIYNVTG